MPGVPETIDNATKNITDYPSKNIGQTLGDIWYLVFGSISQAADKRRMKYAMDLKRYQDELNHATSRIPEKDKLEPSIQVTAQALENSKYCLSSECLRKMFVKLISGSMNRCLEPFVHPSFPEIIKQMSERDAVFLRFMKSTSQIAIANIGLRVSTGGFVDLYKDICAVKPQNMSDDECASAISSLKRAGLIDVTYTQYFSDESYYVPIKNHLYYKNLKGSSTTQTTVHFQKGKCYLTKFGVDFVTVCVE